MNLRPLRIALLGAVTWMIPAALLAQDPMSGDPSTNPSALQNLQPGVPRTQQPGHMQDSTGGTTDPQTMRDKQFLRKASEGGLAEVELGKLALQKSSNDGLKTFAQKMVDDHTTLNDTMKPIADSLGAMTATHMNKMDQAEYDRLKGLSGDDFDKEYIAFMVKDHRVDLHEFRQESATAADPALKDATTKGAKVIREHLTMILKLASDNGVSVPRPEHPAPTD
jgi:putative membrane protein